MPECQGTPCSKQAPYLSLSESNEIRTQEQGIRSFFKSVSTHSNVGKETNPFETPTFAEVPSISSQSTETEIVNEKPSQPDSIFVFPKTTFAKQNRSCQAQWIVEYK